MLEHTDDEALSDGEQTPQPCLRVDATPQEWAALDALWDLISEHPPDPLTNDAVLLRFLRAREMKLPEALKMWLKWVAWRADFKVDSMTEESVAVELNSKKAVWIGRDMQKRPALLIRPRFHCPEESAPEAMVRFAVWMLQEGVHRCDQGLAEGGNTQLAVIYDRRGMTRKNFDKKLFQVALDMVDIAQDYYAERLGKMYVVGANWFYYMMWGIVKPFLSERTKSKVVLLDKTTDLLEHFDADKLYEGWDVEE
eukprot:TRINITY_DN3469_c0_g1_i1.p1 TRINITY_DN3469_c0_g1~~TRINITY_DN3469_c0_g1_i1.p1  ORF type:complete len:253 (+),score=83.76 TRINITY_DN3469_c0_g1_i1:292-1050(+)